MARFKRRTVGMVVLLGLAACAELLGTRDSANVSVSADLLDDNTLRVTVRNDRDGPILLDKSPATQWFQVRETGEWRWPVLEHAVILPLVRVGIEAGEEYTENFETERWRAGEYRANLLLVDGNEVSLPGNPGISNSFRIEHVIPLAKASGWRAELHGSDVPFSLLEIAANPGAAELAWRENVPDTLPSADGVPDSPGVYGDLSEIDFEEYALFVWTSGESGTCPEWIADVRKTQDGAVEVDRRRTSETGVCTDDYQGYRFVGAVPWSRLPDLADLPAEVISDIPGGIATLYPYAP